MSRRSPQSGHGCVIPILRASVLEFSPCFAYGAFQVLTVLFLLGFRRQGDRAPQARISRDVGSRYVLGFVPCARGHVVSQISPEASGIFGCCAELPARHGSAHVGHELVEKGMRVQ